MQPSLSLDLREGSLGLEAGHPITAWKACEPDGSHSLFFLRAAFGPAFPTELREMYLELFPLGRYWVYIFCLICFSRQPSERWA